MTILTQRQIDALRALRPPDASDLVVVLDGRALGKELARLVRAKRGPVGYRDPYGRR